MQGKRLSCVTSSADIIGRNDDLLMEIFIFLLVKPLLRFRAVSKQWRSLIDDKSFRHRHCVERRRRPHHQFILRSAASLLICDITAETLRPLPLNNLNYSHIKILESSHGLLLLDCRKSPHSNKDIVVYNPITSQQRRLINLEAQDPSRFCFIHDCTSKSYGYTVFRLIANPRYLGSTEILVYDSMTEKWETKGRFNGTLHKFRRQGVLCNDGLYFIRCQSPSVRLSLSPNDANGISTVAAPPGFRRLRRKKYVVESKGHLHYLAFSLKKNKKKKSLFRLYEMIDDTCWVMSSEQPLPATSSVDQMEILGFVRGETEQDSILVYHVPEKIMIYRFCDGVSEEIVDFSKESYCIKGVLQFGFKDSHHFVETLAFLST